MWNQRQLGFDDGALVWDESGEGSTVVFLSGGPGDSSRYLRPLAEPLTNEFHCVLADLRGTGRSAVRDVASLSIGSLIEDLEALRLADGADRVVAVGHSFGATLALLYAAACSTVAGAALVGLGPLDEGAAAVAEAKTLAALTPSERAAWAELRRRRAAALTRGEREAFQEAFLAMFQLRLPVLVRDRLTGQRLLEERRKELDHQPSVHTRLNADLAQIDQWAAVRALRTPLLVLYGEHDFEPIEQAEKMATVAPHVEVVLIEGAAHLPWLDRPREVTDALRRFLRAVSEPPAQ